MKCLYGEALEKREVKRQMAAAEKIGELRLGEELLIHRYFFSTKYIRRKDITRVFVRVESGEYGEFPLHEHSLVVIDAGGREHVLHIDHPNFGKETMEKLTAADSRIQTGKPE